MTLLALSQRLCCGSTSKLFGLAFASLFIFGIFQSLSSVGSTRQRIDRVTSRVILRYPDELSAVRLKKIWKIWPSNATFPCFDPGKKFSFVNGSFPLRPFWNKNMPEPPSQGMLFVKPMKVGGSTVSGVQLRISKNMAERQQQNFRICENSYDHVRGLRFKARDPSKSFLWSQVRDPTNRSISFFWHMFVSRGKANATDEDFFRVMPQLKDYYVKVHMLRGPSNNLVKAMNMTLDQQYEWIVQEIFESYDFIGVTERLNESLVVMNLLLQGIVPLGDMLYLSVKVHGGYDNLCNFLLPSNLTANMKQYLESEEWQDIIRWDRILYEAVNASLDTTIDYLGRELVEKTLKRFQLAQQVVARRCQKEVKFGCTDEGERRKAQDTNCLFLDSGCAYECIDRVAQELGLAD